MALHVFAVGLAAAVVASCAPQDPTAPPPPTTIVPDSRAQALAAETIEDFIPTGVSLRLEPEAWSSSGLLGDSTEQRVWVFDAPDDAAAVSAGQELLLHAAETGWTVESQGTDPGLAGSWDAVATKTVPQGRMRLDILAVSSAYASQKGDASQPFLQVTNKLETE